MQVRVYNGRAVIPYSAILGRFDKVFFRQANSPELYGRVELMLPAISNRIYSNYFACSIGRSIIPGASRRVCVKL
jgi:hypothetical protein